MHNFRTPDSSADHQTTGGARLHATLTAARLADDSDTLLEALADAQL